MHLAGARHGSECAFRRWDGDVSWPSVIALQLLEQILCCLLSFIKHGGEDDVTRGLFAKSSRVWGAFVCMG